MASESTFYRLLKASDQQHHRGRSEKPEKRTPGSHCATGPNQVWSWDVTYLSSAIRGQFYYLYMVEDIFSRMIVAWEVHEVESADYAAEMIQKACLKHAIATKDIPLVLHSDNGSPMKGATMLATLQRLGIMPSFSRPRVSDDNPYSESLFRTMKYRPDYPREAFTDLEAARNWVHTFVQWYNETHKHSGLKFITPAQRHRGECSSQMTFRANVYEQAKRLMPHRWGNRATRNWELPGSVWLNPDKSITDHSLN